MRNKCYDTSQRIIRYYWLKYKQKRERREQIMAILKQDSLSKNSKQTSKGRIGGSMKNNLERKLFKGIKA